ncbi:helix-turn-helix transcriptional regulator [Streptomyces sp. MBT58]|uniref:helix-turn-helix transcriptional regulator n=1 Tax=Streptomyces sp. MBT58 TaxID=1488389 RepID=UPI0027DDA4CC|nr:helix-turn-helix transcriptional regulator [Streptomyces sp. MBT58]
MSRALFTEHELAALRLLAQGRTQVEIARILRIRPETVGRLLNRARILLRARTLPHAVARGCEAGLLGPPPHDHGAGQEEHRPSGPDGPNRGQEPVG